MLCCRPGPGGRGGRGGSRPRTLVVEELPRLLSVCGRAERSLPRRKGFFAYLVTGEDDARVETYYARHMWSLRSDMLRLTFRRRTKGALFFPNSTWAQGADALVAAAPRLAAPLHVARRHAAT